MFNQTLCPTLINNADQEQKYLCCKTLQLTKLSVYLPNAGITYK